MPRYEFSEGTSNKFWEINLDGASFTTTYGKIGANGQTTIKKFGSAAEAKKEYDKLVAEKTKKGYALAGDAPAAPAVEEKAVEKVEAKPAAAEKPKAAAKAANSGSSASGKPGARYFEFVEGTSSKFWEIILEDTTVKTRYGKIGTAGQETEKDFDEKGEAYKELNKLVAEKTKKGYTEIDTAGSSGTGKHDARNPELEKAIVADPENQQLYSVFADFLEEQGDPRGELISLQIAGKDKEAKALIQKESEYFLGPLAEHTKCYDGDLGNNNRSNSDDWVEENQQAFLWKNGFIHRVRLAHDSYADEEFQGKLVDILDMLLRHPSGRYVVEFAFNSNGDPNEDDLQDLLDLLGRKAPPTVRKILIGDNVDQISWYHVGNLEPLWKGAPNLRWFEIEAGEFLVGSMSCPNLEHAVFKTGGLAKAAGKSIATAQLPNIRHLDIWYGDDNYGGDCTIKEVMPLLERTDLKHLTHLGLKNSQFSNDIAKAIGGSRILGQLKELDLSMGTLTDEGAEAMAANKDAFKHLEVLDLTHSFLTEKGLALVKGLAKKVITDDQQTPSDYGNGLHYYVAVAE
ncbi:MAG: WGR domain-containing protein [Polyangiales bacterium]